MAGKASAGHLRASEIRRSMETCCRKGNHPELRIPGPTPWFMAKAVPARRSACFPQNGSNKKALGHAGVVSCVGG
jgi:hypothetical protein